MHNLELIESYKKFKERYGKEYTPLMQKLVDEGQSPKTFFITCSDSRVAPNFLTDTKPGDLFIARNIGNFVPPFNPEADASATPAALEYAVSVLKVNYIIVCGHTHCGACKSLHQDIPDEPEMLNIKKWLKFGESAKNQALAYVGKEDKEKLYAATEKFNIIDQMKNLLTYPAVKKRVEDGELFIVGWYYHLHNGDLEYFDPIEHRFLPVEKALEK
jgi:carbonic anhydrase